MITEKQIAEDAHLIAVFDWVRAMGYEKFIWHTANERKCSLRAGQRLKRKGVKSGVSDITIARARNGYHGAYIELKTKGGRLTPSQSLFLKDMEQEGYYTNVCYSAIEAIDCIKNYLR